MVDVTEAPGRAPTQGLPPRADTARPPDHLGPVLAPRRRPAVPAVHVQQQLHHDLPVEQRPQPARHHPVDHHQRRQLRGAPCRRLEHLLCAHPGGHRTGTAVPPDRATGTCRVVLLGLRRLVLRGRPRPALHRIGLRPHRRSGFGVPLRADRPDGMATVSSHRGGRGDGTERRHRVLGRRTGHRRGGDAAPRVVRVLVAGGGPVPAARTTGPRRRCRVRSRACRRGSRARTPTFSTALATISAVAACGPRGCWPSARWSSGSGPSCSVDRLRSSPRVVCWRPSSG